jgi:hypothetical protein
MLVRALERKIESRWVDGETVPIATKDPVLQGLECSGGSSYGYLISQLAI